MIRHIQSKVSIKNSNDETLSNGNCWATAIGCVMELPMTEVANIEVWYHKNETNTGFWDMLTDRFVNNHGWMFDQYAHRFNVFHQTKEEFDSHNWHGGPFDYDTLREQLKNEYYFVSGISPRGLCHVTIWQGDKMVHDPHISQEGVDTTPEGKKQYFQVQWLRPMTQEEKDWYAHEDNYTEVRFHRPYKTYKYSQKHEPEGEE
jgi:hypothetical protein